MGGLQRISALGRLGRYLHTLQYIFGNASSVLHFSRSSKLNGLHGRGGTAPVGRPTTLVDLPELAENPMMGATG